MDCTEPEKLKLAEFSLKNKAKVWWKSVRRVHEDDKESIGYELYRVVFEKKYVPSVARDRKETEFAWLVWG